MHVFEINVHGFRKKAAECDSRQLRLDWGIWSSFNTGSFAGHLSEISPFWEFQFILSYNLIFRKDSKRLKRGHFVILGALGRTLIQLRNWKSQILKNQLNPSGQIIATSNDLTPNGRVVGEPPTYGLISGKPRLVKYYNLARSILKRGSSEPDILSISLKTSQSCSCTHSRFSPQIMTPLTLGLWRMVETPQKLCILPWN